MSHHLTDSYRHQGMRRALVETLRQKGIKDERVLEAISRIPRHYFFETAFLEHAYQDKAFPIAEGQTISQPYTVAYQTELLQLKSTDKVLEIGTGSGYQCAVLMHLCDKVYSIEFHKKLHLKAQSMLTSLKLKPKLFVGDGSLGLPHYAPFDAILVTAGAPMIPETLLGQLALGGRLVIPVGDSKVQQMIRITRTQPDRFEKQVFDDFRFVPLVGKEGWN